MNIAFSTFESILCNSYFLIGLLTTIYYWTKAIFFSENKKFGFFGLFLINSLIVLQLSSRWVVSGHFPLSSLYESLLFLAWGINTIYLIIEYITHNEFIGVLVSPILLCILGFTGFSLPPELQEMKPLVPALQSNWLFMHVSVMMLSYAGLLVGSILSIAYLVIYTSLKNKNFFQSKNTFADDPKSSEQDSGNQIEDVFSLENQKFVRDFEAPGNSLSINSQVISAFSLASTSEMFVKEQPSPFTTSGNDYKSSLSSVKKSSMQEKDKWKQIDMLLILFDNLSYRTIGIGFCFLTLGILSGAVWANETWGSYWSWDPKETWALITWALFAIYLHTRLVRGSQGIVPAAIATFGFVLVWVCYLGVNILGKGLHSYGFLQ